MLSHRDIEKEKVLQTLLEISNATVFTRDIKELTAFIREQLGKLMDTTNFYIALYHPEDNTFTIPFFSDLKDHFERVPAEKTLSYYVIKTNRSLLVREKEFKELVKKGEVKLVGTDSKVWVGVPLRVNEKIIGMVSVQSYVDENTYTEEDKDILELISYQIGLAIDRKQKEEELEIEKTYFEQLFQNIPEATVIQEYPGTITDANVAFNRLFGFKAGEVVGKRLDDLIIPEDYRKEAAEFTERSFNGQVIETETVRMKKNGERIEVSLITTPFRISENKTIIYALYRDIRKKKEVERKLLAAKEKAEEADRMKTAFLTNMSHEIRTPMNAILGFAQLLSIEKLSGDQKTEYVNIIKNSGDSLLRLIDDILDLAKLEAGQIVMKEEYVDLDELMESLFVTFKKLLSSHYHADTIKLKMKEQARRLPFKIKTDPLRLRQILNNLLSNAVKFTHKGYVEFGYEVIREEREILFYVQDTGIGIPGDKLDLIFKRFQQVDSSKTRVYSGTGLGLAISKRLTNLLGGKIWVESEEGKGSRFSFTIPLKTVENRIDMRITPVFGNSPDVAKNIIGKSILIAEDDEFNFIYLREVLEQAGFNVYHAGSGKEAVHFFQERKGKPAIDLVLMDIEMPGMNGYEATEIIKKDFSNIPVIAQTAYASSEEKNKCLAAGCDSYLAKPLQIDDLLNEIKKYL
jgi:PAS domain S-box-containing protein